MRRFAFFVLPVLCLFSQETASPRQVAKELEEAQTQFNRAKQMFNPWYTGPLITPAPGMMPPGKGNIQPYLFFEGTYATFNKNRKSVSLPHNKYFIELTSGMAFGITDSVDCGVTPSAIVNRQKGQTGGGFNDLTANLGFLITPETLYIPGMKFTITETFPTGKYNNLSLNGLGLDSTGGGSYQTEFGFAIAKLLWWFYEHPVKLRYFVGYTVATPVHVKGFNTYGGDITTRGTVHPGNTLATDFGIECSLTQHLVLALDTVYTAQNRTKFNGSTISPVGGGYNDNLSFAPAIEYIWSPDLGIVFGSQFSVYGRNSANFANGQFSVTYTW